MIEDRCVLICKKERLKVAENGRSAVFRRMDQVRLTKITVDGCLDIDGPKADYVIERGRFAVVVELKGRDVEHAAKQVHATALLWTATEGRCDRIAGLIVARQYPKASSSVQLKQQKFSRAFKGPLHVVTGNFEFNLDDVLSFKGPLRR